MPDYRSIMDKYIYKLQEIYGSKMKAVILYGSYARGDYTAESDIDIMLLVDMPDKEISKLFAKTSDMTYDFNFDNHTDISLLVKDINQFYKWVMVHPFYQNVQKEGVVLYGAA